MLGEILALLAAFCFAVSGVAIAKGASATSGDNGALLSIVLTALLSGSLWIVAAPPYASAASSFWPAISFFVATGVLATVIGRSLLFKSVVAAGAIKATMLRRLTPLFAALFAFAILDERISGMSALGMALILASFLGVIRRRAIVPARSVEAREAEGDRTMRPANRDWASAFKVQRPVGELYGVVSAACYGVSYVTRKMGMQHVPDPAMGTLVAALTGLAWYVAAAPFRASYRDAIVGLYRDTGRWQFVAAAGVSLGQTLTFFALQHSAIASVSIIGSLDIFISIYLAAYLLHTEPPPSRAFLAATVIATAGVILVALG